MLLVLLLVLSSDLQEAIRHFRDGRLGQAESALRRALAADASSAAAWRWLGVVYASQSQYEAAEPAFRQACRLDPKDPDACYYFGRCLYSLNRFEPALKPLEQALSSGGPRTGRVLLAIAQALEALGRDQEAERRFRDAIKAGGAARPEEDARLHYGVFLIRQGRLTDALKPLQETPASARSLFELGRALYQLERLEPAADHLRKAVHLDPNYGAAHLLLGKVYMRQGKTEEAEKHSRLGEVTAPDSRPVR